MEEANIIFKKDLENLVEQFSHYGINVNDYAYDSLGINLIFLRRSLNFIAPILTFFQCLLLFIYYTSVCFLRVLLTKSKTDTLVKNDSRIFAFFTPLFYGRLAASGLFDESKFWIVGPNIRVSAFNLTGKSIINYKLYLNKSDYIKILIQELKTLSWYFRDYKTIIYPIYRCRDFFETYFSLEKICGPNDEIFFSNQSDRWALLFDQCKCRKRYLLQHGVDFESIPWKHKLNNIDVFYSISDTTWQNSYKSLLNCSPQVKFMKPTISLLDIGNQNFSVLIVAYENNIDKEIVILDMLSKYKVDIYLKKHPGLLNDKMYIDLKNKYHFNYITDSIFPRVDFVISYYSTLAFEYLSYKIPVFIYEESGNDFNIENIRMAFQKEYHSK